MLTKPTNVLVRRSPSDGSLNRLTGILLERLDAAVHGMGKGLKSRIGAIAPSQLKKHRILGGPLRGFFIVTSWQHYYTGIIGTTEPDLIAWFEKTVQPGESWLDVGANYGYTALALRRRVGPQGRVFAFEPKLSTCGCLSQTMLLNAVPEVTVVPVALGSPDTLELKQFITIGGMVVSAPAAGESIETIVVARLDWLWPQICGSRERIDGAKIDVQGMELEVLQGMTELLKLYHPKLVIELHSGVDRTVLLDLLERCGYGRQGTPVRLIPGEELGPQYHDNLSYAFAAR